MSVPPQPKAVYEKPVIVTDDFSTARNAGSDLSRSGRSSNGGTGGNGTSGDYNVSLAAGYTAVDNANSKRDTAAEARRAVALENPLVQETLQIFGGEIVDE
jgi:hypothetical protein